MSIVLDGSNGVTFPNGSNPQAAPSKVLQVVQATNSTQTTTSSNSLVATNVTASITPLFSTSKILVLLGLASVGKNSNATSQGVTLALYRNGSNIFSITDLAAFTNSALYNCFNLSSNYLDSPATTSSTTYTVYLASTNNNGTVFVNNYLNTQSLNNSTIILMEIAA